MTRHNALLSTIVIAVALGATTLGCGNRNDDDFNPVGQLGVEGEGAVSYVAPQDGTIYVYGGKDNQLVYSGPVKKGETFSVEPREKRLTIDGRVIQEGALDTGNRHRIYLDARDSMSGTSGTGASGTSVRTSGGAGTGGQDRVIIESGPRSTEYRPVPAQSK